MMGTRLMTTHLFQQPQQPSITNLLTTCSPNQMTAAPSHLEVNTAYKTAGPGPVTPKTSVAFPHPNTESEVGSNTSKYF